MEFSSALKDILLAVISGVVTLTGVFIGWILAVKREKEGKKEELQFKKDIINQEVSYITEEVKDSILSLISFLNELAKGNQNRFVYRRKLMTMVFDEHFKHAALSFSESDSKRIKDFYSHVYEYNNLVANSNSISNDSLKNSSSSTLAQAEITITGLLLRSAEIIKLSGLNCDCKADTARQAVAAYFDLKKKS